MPTSRLMYSVLDHLFAAYKSSWGSLKILSPTPRIIQNSTCEDTTQHQQNMTARVNFLGDRHLDSLLFNLESLKQYGDISRIVSHYLDGEYKIILHSPTSQGLIQKLSETVQLSGKDQAAVFEHESFKNDLELVLVLTTGLASINAFLQANVTGPSMDFGDIFKGLEWDPETREQCLRSLDVDGISVYQHIPLVELFCLARMIFVSYFPRIVNSTFRDCRWMRIRINVYHQRLLSGLSGGRLSDSTLLQDLIEKDLKTLEVDVLGPKSEFSTETKVQFLLEKAQIYIMEGLDFKAKENVKMASKVSGFTYALSGALGKRTKFQQKDVSQLVVFAKSKELDQSKTELDDSTLASNGIEDLEKSIAPEALELNDDTLLESIAFKKNLSERVDKSSLPSELAGMQPDEQPQLLPLDQITLLTEATLKDAFSPLDKLNREEILPYAVRVLSDKPTNWQIYTQALLVRSRIESHRSRTQERSVLQLQVIVDQIIADTQEGASLTPDGIPQIQITSFLPRAKASESARVEERLKYIFQLNTPTRWEIETELAYAWSNAGSLVSALEIFKRLKLWAEVALCYHSVGQEDKARQVVRRQLYYSSKGKELDQYDIDAPEIVTEKWDGEMRSPPPPHSPRLWCILGDLNQDPTCWQRAWEISKNRYARAQRSLGDHYTRKGDFSIAREAFMKATIVNRQNNDTWSRLGDIDLAVGNWDGAIIAFQQSIMIDDTDAKTYSNLGSALLSKHAEMIASQKVATAHGVNLNTKPEANENEEDFSSMPTADPLPNDVLRQALLAYKRGAALAYDNWQIWDNVITVAGRMSPPSFPEILMGMRNIIRIRSSTISEAAIDIDILRALVLEVTSRERDTSADGNGNGIYIPERGSLARATIEMINSDIIPLITTRSELWNLVEKVRLYQRDFSDALKCAEKSWRMVSVGDRWLEDEERWKSVVAATDNLVSAYENYGVREKVNGELVEKGWRQKARSAVRGVLGRAKDTWEDSEGYEALKTLLEDLKS